MDPEAPRSGCVHDLTGRDAVRLPVVLAGLHHRFEPGREVRVRLDIALSTNLQLVADLMAGAGFDQVDIDVQPAALVTVATRARTLPDIVGPGMRLLVCGLNPSLYSADRGVGYARPGNRFWPAALAAGVAGVDRDPLDTLANHGVGMTDLVKRATTAAAELQSDEYRAGAARVERMVRWLCPGAVCFVGLAGWRAAIDRTAVAGAQPQPFGGRPAYVMPSTSGLNARCPLEELTGHLEAAAALASTTAPPDRVRQ